MISLEDFIVESKNLSALEDYINKVYAIVLLSVPGACQAAGVLYTLEKIIGLLPMVSWLLLIVFDMTCLLYLGIGIFFVKTGYRNHMVLQNKLRSGKLSQPARYFFAARPFWHSRENALPAR